MHVTWPQVVQKAVEFEMNIISLYCIVHYTHANSIKTLPFHVMFTLVYDVQIYISFKSFFFILSVS